MNQTQDRISTPAEAELASQICASLASFFEAKLAKRFLQPFGALSVRTAEIGKSFHENLLGTGTPFTEKTTHMQNEKDGTPNGGKIA